MQEESTNQWLSTQVECRLALDVVEDAPTFFASELRVVIEHEPAVVAGAIVLVDSLYRLGSDESERFVMLLWLVAIGANVVAVSDIDMTTVEGSQTVRLMRLLLQAHSRTVHPSETG